MKKRLNLRLLDARHSDYETRIGEARWLENLNNQGKSVQEIEEEARKFLNFGENESFIADAEKRVIEYNLLKRSLRDINVLTTALENANLVSSEELNTLNSIEDRLADKVMGIYNIDREDLYEEE